ncbi:MAG: hypothetical protein P8M11_08480 [Planctomycetota bacterium]|nr:hypothetical protein [Planctomycetota bacterium]MDG1984589.1 hypothetical protein [Planctomycetota bacterium]
MSQQPQNPGAATSHQHDDDLIVVPEGKSRLRYIATIGLVLFLLIIFVVADTFQASLTGGGGEQDPVYLTWTDPVTGEPEQVLESEFFATSRDLSIASNFIFRPFSLEFGDPETTRGERGASEEDVASFLVLEDMALDAGIAISQEEHRALLAGVFGTDAGLRGYATRARMTVEQLEGLIRRCERIQKLQGLMMTAVVVPDPAAIEAEWKEANPLFKFQVVTTKTEPFLDQARSEVLDDEALAAWYHEQPIFRQQTLFTQPTVTPDVAYVPLGEGAEFDAAALLAAYPAPEGTDLEEQARSYHVQNRSTRFRVPADEQKKATIGEDGEAVVPEVPKLFYDLEEVREQVDYEAPIHAAMRALLTDLQDRATAGEELDFAAEAGKFGLTFVAGPDGGFEREAIATQEAWGTPMIAGQLIFAEEGSLLPSVMVSENALTVARSRVKRDREEPPFADIREEVLEMRAEDRSKEIAVETLDGVRLVLAAKPEDVEAADWRPEIGLEEMQKLTSEAGYSIIERDWLTQNAVPNDDFSTASPVERFLRGNVDMHALEAGQVAPAVASPAGDEVYLVRMEGKKDQAVEEIGAQGLLTARQAARFEDRRAFGAKVFLGDGEWMKGTVKVRFPERERREAEKDASAS